ncbi:DegT/DnrJ/EryC1/StrS family aminotransferase [bacterium]|nr:DegT/DnrJ/EryC1/StrS family aminotransferase [bacterium]
MKVPFVDFVSQDAKLRGEILEGWSRILDSGKFVCGSEVRQFEEEFAQACGVKHCIAVSSGTDALLLLMHGLGLRQGDEVVVPANTFIATAAAVHLAGGRPLFVDCHPLTRTIDAESVQAVLESRPVSGVLAVHLYGEPADMAPILEAARTHGCWVAEDAAQAHLAEYAGRRVGSLGVAGCFSFYPGKNLGGPGEGGAVTTNDTDLDARLRMLRDHGQTEKYVSRLVGFNARMTEPVALALRVKLRHLSAWTEARRNAATRYKDLLSQAHGIELPCSIDGSNPVFHLFVVHVRERDRVKEYLEHHDIGVGLHYPIPIHLQTAFTYLGHQQGDFPHAEYNASHGISLPMFPNITNQQIDYVVETLMEAIGEG